MLPGSGPKEERPPYVIFETQLVEDRAASLETKTFKTKDVDFAILTPIGSKDRIPREWNAWIDSLEQQAREGRVPNDWPQHYRKMYGAWKSGQEAPLSGTPIKGWPVLSPAQQANIISANIRTVEDLARINEEAQRSIGMGALDFRDRALAWLQQASGAATEIKELKEENRLLRERLDALEHKATK